MSDRNPTEAEVIERQVLDLEAMPAGKGVSLALRVRNCGASAPFDAVSIVGVGRMPGRVAP